MVHIFTLDPILLEEDMIIQSKQHTQVRKQRHKQGKQCLQKYKHLSL